MKLNIQRFAPDYDQLDVPYDHIKKGDGTKLQVDSAIRDDEGYKISIHYAKKNELPTVNDATLTIQKNGTNVQTFTANQSTNATANIIVPTKTSDLTNDDNVVKDASYVHTDNNYTTTEKNKLSGIASGAEVNVQSDWNVSDSSSDAFIKNKPNLSPVATQTTVGTSDRPIYLNNGTATQTNTPVSGGWFKGVPFVTNAGVMEIGRYIDFHPTNDSSLDFSKRLDAGSGTTARTLTLPDKTGTIAITSDLPTKTSDLTNDGDDGSHLFVDTTDIGSDLRFNAVTSIIQSHGTNYDVVDGAELHSAGMPIAYISTNAIKYDDGNGHYTALKDVIDGKQPKLTAGTNITIDANNVISASGGGGTATDVQVNGTSITSGGVANLVTQTAYNSSTNKIATKSDIPTKVSQLTNDSGFTSNTGTITGINMNGSSKGTSGVVDLGTVITSHQTIKTINNTSMTGSGNVSVQPTLVSGTNIKTVNSTSLLGSGNVAVQPTLVSGTNIKTINSTSLLGSGNISVQPTLSVTTGTNAVTKTSGNATIRESNYYQYGKVVEMRLVLDTTASTSAGSNVFQGTIKSALKPKDYITGVGFNGSTIQIGQISPDGEVLVRTFVGSLASNKATGLHFIYVIS